MTFRHRLLQRQVRKYLGANAAIPPELEQLLQAVEGAYDQFDADRKLMDRAMALSSAEIAANNERLLAEDAHRRALIEKLKESVRSMQLEVGSTADPGDDLIGLITVLQRLIEQRNAAEAAMRAAKEAA